jgi:acylphosphatase
MEEQAVDLAAGATLRATVRGRVQGVGYRMFVVRAARGLRLRGYVKNQHDRTVYVVAAGPRPALERLLAMLREGPLGARVSEVSTDWLDSETEALEPEFEVRF